MPPGFPASAFLKGKLDGSMAGAEGKGPSHLSRQLTGYQNFWRSTW